MRSLLDWGSDEEAEGGDLVLGGGGSWLHRKGGEDSQALTTQGREKGTRRERHQPLKKGGRRRHKPLKESNQSLKAEGGERHQPLRREALTTHGREKTRKLKGRGRREAPRKGEGPVTQERGTNHSRKGERHSQTQREREEKGTNHPRREREKKAPSYSRKTEGD